MSVRSESVIPGARIRVKNGKPVLDLLAGTAGPGHGRAPFSVWPLGGQMMDSQYVHDGEEFEIILAPRRKKAVYSHFEVSSKFVALRRLRDSALMEVFYVHVRFDADLVSVPTAVSGPPASP